MGNQFYKLFFLASVDSMLTVLGEAVIFLDALDAEMKEKEE